MNSREIIIDLINKNVIDGEQAFVLINDLLKGELLEAWETLNASKENKNYRVPLSDLNSVWVSNPNYNTYTTTGYSGTISNVDITSSTK